MCSTVWGRVCSCAYNNTLQSNNVLYFGTDQRQSKQQPKQHCRAQLRIDATRVALLHRARSASIVSKLANMKAMTLSSTAQALVVVVTVATSLLGANPGMHLTIAHRLITNMCAALC
jgi:hypothetical protein